MIHEWDGIFDLDSEEECEIEKERHSCSSDLVAGPSGLHYEPLNAGAVSSGHQEDPSSLENLPFNPKDPLNLEEVEIPSKNNEVAGDSDEGPPAMEALFPVEVSIS